MLTKLTVVIILQIYLTQVIMLCTLNLYSTVCQLYSVGAHGRPPPNVPQGHIYYFELQLLKKRPMQEGHSDTSVSLKAGNKISHVKDALPASAGKRTSLSPETGNSG